jgi:hypothetical protein
MKTLRILSILLAVSLICVFGSGDVQAKNKWKEPAKIELQNCSLVRLSYLAPAEAAMALLPDGYEPAPPPFTPEGTVYVFADLTQCENIRIGDEFDVGGGTLYHEILVGGVFTPEGEIVQWGFPATHTNPLAREALQKVGMPCRPARDLWIEVNLVGDTVSGGVLTDNLKPFGPDIFSTYEGPSEYWSTWPAGAKGGAQYHAWGGGVTKLTWSNVGENDVDFYLGPVPDVDWEGDFVLPVLEMQVFPPFSDRIEVIGGGGYFLLEAVE